MGRAPTVKFQTAYDMYGSYPSTSEKGFHNSQSNIGYVLLISYEVGRAPTLNEKNCIRYVLLVSSFKVERASTIFKTT